MSPSLLFTIITPALNSEKTIARTIESVLSQSIEAFEYLIIDGGSSDRTLDVIKGFNDVRIILTSEKDSGIFNAMNKGLIKAKGLIIGIINSDDWYAPNAFENILASYNNNSATVFYGDVAVYDNEKAISLLKANHDSLPFNMIPHPGIFCLKDVYLRLGEFNESFRIAADYDFMLNAYNSGEEFLNLKLLVANYQIGGFSDIPKNRIRSIFEKYEIQSRWMNTSKFQRDRRFLVESLKTILRRDCRIQMLHELAKTFTLRFNKNLKRIANE